MQRLRKQLLQLSTLLLGVGVENWYTGKLKRRCHSVSLQWLKE